MDNSLDILIGFFTNIKLYNNHNNPQKSRDIIFPVQWLINIHACLCIWVEIHV